MDMIEIVPYQPAHQVGIDAMMQEIAQEFIDPIMVKQTNGTAPIPDNYWVALHNGQVVETIALVNFKNEFGVLKRMMLKTEFRGAALGVSSLLLFTAIENAKKNSLEAIYLGTMTQFKAAQRFYQKHGFQQIGEEELPSDFPKYPIDKLFYKKKIA
ncbi:MAG: GNAT family N-acetyltransferase [Cytophagales bacterium CG12_big_fil_rev_8_21_14_0_65_40_12]|nr:MAG: GNAT family N-acetyltransferase [Cytophagales bacterium CG12_big_fil_rev_8_21_14_0_65_40_12]PIW03484.1 MAG: GNAT family N-acetyltransferase [Cytophagales bacterium CG17_big_fil_post_rev_8_21_14_2_50_40_13]